MIEKKKRKKNCIKESEQYNITFDDRSVKTDATGRILMLCLKRYNDHRRTLKLLKPHTPFGKWKDQKAGREQKQTAFLKNGLGLGALPASEEQCDKMMSGKYLCRCKRRGDRVIIEFTALGLGEGRGKGT